MAMIEVLVAAGFVMAVVVAFSRRSGALVVGSRSDDRRDTEGADLPCPWCSGPTGEEDARCRTCGQRFG